MCPKFSNFCWCCVIGFSRYPSKRYWKSCLFGYRRENQGSIDVTDRQRSLRNAALRSILSLLWMVENKSVFLHFCFILMLKIEFKSVYKHLTILSYCSKCFEFAKKKSKKKQTDANAWWNIWAMRLITIVFVIDNDAYRQSTKRSASFEQNLTSIMAINLQKACRRRYQDGCNCAFRVVVWKAVGNDTFSPRRRRYAACVFVPEWCVSSLFGEYLKYTFWQHYFIESWKKFFLSYYFELVFYNFNKLFIANFRYFLLKYF